MRTLLFAVCLVALVASCGQSPLLSHTSAPPETVQSIVDRLTYVRAENGKCFGGAVTGGSLDANSAWVVVEVTCDGLEDEL